MMVCIDNHSFSGKTFGGPITNLSSATFAKDRLNVTGFYAHSVGYHLHTDLTILEYNVFNSTTVFFANCFGWTFWPWLNFKSTSALTKIGSAHLTTTYNGTSSLYTTVIQLCSVYLLWLNVLQCQNFYHCMISNFVKISHSAQAAIFHTLCLVK